MNSTDLVAGSTCAWREYDDRAYFAECGEGFQFDNYGPDENGFRFCPYCGRRIALLQDAHAGAQTESK